MGHVFLILMKLLLPLREVKSVVIFPHMWTEKAAEGYRGSLLKVF